MGMIPHITVQIDDNRKLSAEGITTLSLGFGLLQAWVLTAMYAAPLVFGSKEIASSLGTGTTSLIYLASALTYSLLMGAAGCLDQRMDSILRHDSACIVAGMCSVLGTLAMLSPEMASNPYLEIGLGALTGIGSSYLALIWGCRLSRLDPRDIALNSALSLTIGFILFAVIAAIPHPMGGIAAAMLPMGSTLAVIWHRRTRGVPEGPVIGCTPRPLDVKETLIRFTLPVFVFGIGLALLKQTSSLSLLLSPTPAEQVSIVASACIAFALFLAMAAFTSKSGDALRFFKPMVPLIAISAPLALLSDSQSTPNLPSVLFLAAYICFHMLLWDFFGELCQRHRLSPIRIFGWGRCLISLTSVIIAFPAWPIDASSNLLLSDHTFQIMILPVVILIAFVLLPSAEGVEAMARTLPPDATTSASAPDQESQQTQETVQAAAEDAEDATSPQEPTTPIPGEAHASSQDLAAPERGIAPQDASPDAAEGALHPKPTAPSLTDQCHIIANQYQLSARETEVLTLLARGRNASYIMEHLYISEGTTKTHMRHIYRKLDVHSQQELIQLVQEAQD